MSSKDNNLGNRVLDFFYSQTKEEDWLEGLDLYELGRIEQLSNFDGLFSAKVLCFSNQTLDVRIRIRESELNAIFQWVECSCTKNRKYNLYCSHIVALILQLNKSEAALFSKLKSLTSREAPTTKVIKDPFKLSKENKHRGTQSASAKKATHSFLNRLKGNIKQFSFKNDGFFEVEMKGLLSELSFHTLSLDSLADYLKQSQEDLPKVIKGKAAFQLHQNPASLCLHIYEKRKNLYLEKSFFLPEGAQDKNNPLYYEDKKALKLYPFDENCYLGDRYLYHKTKGFFPLTDERKLKGFRSLSNQQEILDGDSPEFFEKRFPKLLKSHQIYLPESLKDSWEIKTPTLKALGSINEERGWFYLDPVYQLEGESISMASLIDSYQNKKKSYFKTKKGWVKVPDFIKDNTWDLHKSQKTTSVSMNKLGLLRLQALAGEFDHLVGSKKTLFHSAHEKPAEPFALKASQTHLNLRPYQKEGLEWLTWLYNSGLHGLLADDMGLGKTHQAMALLDLVREINHREGKPAAFLIICPTTVIDHWLNKLDTFAPKLKAKKHHGNKRSLKLKAEDSATILTSYGVLLRDYQKLKEKPWDVMILDEAHFVKNHKTMTYKAACEIESRFRLCLTGTPMENHLGELKSLFDFLAPGYLGSNKFFNQEFMTPIQQNDDFEKEDILQKLIYPLKLRRTKSEVLKDLPKKIEDLRYCPLSSEQSALYQETLKKRALPLLDQIKGDKPLPYLHIFSTLQLLKQICNHPALIHGKPEEFERFESGKFELLKELLSEAIRSKQKVVIFSQYLGMIKCIETYCKKEGIGCVSLTGATQNRGKVIEKFQEDPKIDIFIGSLLAGGMGIDLTAASVVIHYDRWWNASKENQATDRVHRIGQKKSVQVFKLVTKGTLEEKIDELIKKKAGEFHKFFEQDKTIFKSLSKEDIINLLS